MTTEPSPANFVEVCLYEVKAAKVAEFEDLIKKVLEHHSGFPGDKTHAAVGERDLRPVLGADGPRRSRRGNEVGVGGFYRDFRRCLLKPPKIILGERVR